MTDVFGIKRYLRLFEQIGAIRARAMVDKLQIVALTSPATLRELEAFLDRNLGLESAPHDRRRGRRAPTELVDDYEDDDDDDDDPTTSR
jgi:hypothetical protein